MKPQKETEPQTVDEALKIAEPIIRDLLIQAGAPAEFFDHLLQQEEGRLHRALQDAIPNLYLNNHRELGKQALTLYIDSFLSVGGYKDAISAINIMQYVSDKIKEEVMQDVMSLYDNEWLEKIYAEASKKESAYSLEISSELIWQSQKFYLKDIDQKVWQKRYQKDLQKNADEFTKLYSEQISDAETKIKKATLDEASTEHLLAAIEQLYILAISKYQFLNIEKLSNQYKGPLLEQVLRIARFLRIDRNTVLQDLDITQMDILLLKKYLSKESLNFFIQNKIAKILVGIR